MIALIGVVASMFLPIIVCQFFYMPFVAVPAWHKPTWTTDIKADNISRYPGIVIATDGYNRFQQVVQVNISQPECTVINAADSSQPSENKCRFGVQRAPVGINNYQFFTFDSKDLADIASSVARMSVYVSFKCKLVFVEGVILCITNARRRE